MPYFWKVIWSLQYHYHYFILIFLTSIKFYLQTVETVFPFLIITTFLFKIGYSISGKLQFSNRKITRSADA